MEQYFWTINNQKINKIFIVLLFQLILMIRTLIIIITIYIYRFPFLVPFLFIFDFLFVSLCVSWVAIKIIAVANWVILNVIVNDTFVNIINCWKERFWVTNQHRTTTKMVGCAGDVALETDCDMIVIGCQRLAK